MDFGSLVCTKRGPKCELCPLRKDFCKAAFRVKVDGTKKKPKKEPGREIAGKFVPDRIIRGRIVEFLRDATAPAALPAIGAHVCIDWNAEEHKEWLKSILRKLEQDALIQTRGKKFLLAH